MADEPQPTDPDDGAFAFPETEESWEQEGLTKREYFSAVALEGLLADPRVNTMSHKQVTQNAVRYAEQLIHELNNHDYDAEE